MSNYKKQFLLKNSTKNVTTSGRLQIHFYRGFLKNKIGSGTSFQDTFYVEFSNIFFLL